MIFDWTISLGTILSALLVIMGTWATVSRLYSLLDKRLAVFENILDDHANTLIRHSTRMEKHDDIIIKMTGDMQRIIGRLEVDSLNKIK